MIEYINDYQLWSQDAEQSLIGGILINNHNLPDVLEIVTSEDFYHAYHKILFRAIEKLYEAGTPVDVTTLISRLGDEITQCGNVAYLIEIGHSISSAVHIVAYAKTVSDKRKERDVFQLADKMKEAIMDDGESEDKINNALSIVSGYDVADDKEVSFGQQNVEFLTELEARSKLGGGLTGVPSGFIDIDKRFNGFQKSDLIVVAGRPGSGKTTYALNAATNVAKTKPVIFFSMEMSSIQIVEKIYSSRGVDLRNIKTGQLADDEWASVSNAGAFAKSLNITIDDRPALTPQQVTAKAMRLKRKHGEIGMIIVDYLQLMRTNKSEGRTDEITKISGALKALAKLIDCPVIALSQLNRTVESRKSKRPMMSDLRDSGAIEQDADIIQFIYRDDYYAEQENRPSENPFVAEINTAKYRGGEVGCDFLRTELQYSRFRDLPDNYQPPEPEAVKGFSYG